MYRHDEIRIQDIKVDVHCTCTVTFHGANTLKLHSITERNYAYMHCPDISSLIIPLCN